MAPQENNGGEILEVKIAELIKTKEELKKAKEVATQSWLDSRPLIDKLERSKSRLSNCQSRFSASKKFISELESRLKSVNESIKSKKAEELETRRNKTEISMNIDQTRKGLEILKLDISEEQRLRSRLMRIQKLRRHTLRTLHLTLRSITLESEAFGASLAEAHRHIKNSETDNSSVVELGHEEYETTTRKAKQETSLADWRILMSMKQKFAAEARRNLVLSRLGESYERCKITKEQEEDIKLTVDAKAERGFALPDNQFKIVAETSRGNPQPRRRSRNNNNKGVKRKKRIPVFHQIKRCLLRSITRLFA